MRGKDAINKDKWILFKMTQTLPIAFPLFDYWLLKKVHKISLVKTLTVWQLKVELESLHELKFYKSLLLLMIKMSQSAHEKLESYCENIYIGKKVLTTKSYCNSKHNGKKEWLWLRILKWNVVDKLEVQVGHLWPNFNYIIVQLHVFLKHDFTTNGNLHYYVV